MNELTRKPNVVKYTAISNNYDNLIQPTFVSKDFDYICFTDEEIKEPGVWSIRPMDNNKLDPVRRSKYYKMHPHKLFPEYEYSVWIDSNIDIADNTLEKRINKLIKADKKLSLNIHFERNCIYDEAYVCIRDKKDDPEIILKQVNFLKKEGYPRKNGLFEANIIFRKHHDIQVAKLMEDWWEMVTRFSYRDQLSFNYVLTKNLMLCDPLFKHNARSLDGFSFKPHNSKCVSTLYTDKEKYQNITVISEDKFSARFEFSETLYLDEVQFNLIKGKFCSIQLDKLVITTPDDKEINIDISKFVTGTNGQSLDHNIFEFKLTSDPRLVININREVVKLIISGTVEMFETEKLYLHTVKEKLRISKKLNKIQKEVTELKTII